MLTFSKKGDYGSSLWILECFLWGVHLPLRKTAIKKYEGKTKGVYIIFSETKLLELEYNVCLEKSRCYNKYACCVLIPVIFSEKSQRPAPV